ncbi:MAG TPA: UPF0158 family protein [Candidatus Methylomirabilis sp.]|nr:UPF0158 family protein [Candidatus Methylomirabilis sp.]
MPIPVKLSDVVGEMQMLGDQTFTYLNRLTGEMVTVTAEARHAAEDPEDWDLLPDWQREEMPKIKEALESEDYHVLPREYEIHEWSIMEQFAHSVEDEEASDELLTALHGRGAFRYFKDTVRRLGIVQDWYRFRDEATKEIARDWLRDHGIPFVE